MPSQTDGVIDERADVFAGLRRRMVAEQIAARGVRDPRVLAAMGRVPRHEFVPEFLRDHAYADMPLPVGYGQTISQPYIVAQMSELAALDERSHVLEIGTGTGYQAAVLSELAAGVWSIERVSAMAVSAAHRLARLGCTNVRVRAGDGYRGWPEDAPFDAIIVTAAPLRLPGALVAQLRDGGRMVIPVGPPGLQDLVVAVLHDGTTTVERIEPVSFVPMIADGG